MFKRLQGLDNALLCISICTFSKAKQNAKKTGENRIIENGYQETLRRKEKSLKLRHSCRSTQLYHCTMRLSLDVSLCSNEYTCSAYKRKGKGHPPNNGRDPQHMAADKRAGLAGGHLRVLAVSRVVGQLALDCCSR